MPKAQISVRVDTELLKKAQKALGARNNTVVIERSLSAVVEIEKHRRLIRRFSGTGKPDDFRES